MGTLALSEMSRRFRGHVSGALGWKRSKFSSHVVHLLLPQAPITWVTSLPSVFSVCVIVPTN